MRKIIHWNIGWEFQKGNTPVPALWEQVKLPHTWNTLDGQDGGGDYYQGIGWYRKRFTVEPECRELYVRFEGDAHFDVTTFGTDALFVTAKPDGSVNVVAHAPEGTGVHVEIRDPDGSIAASGDGISRNGKVEIGALIAEPRLWDGLEAPNL